jgi:hypothetical protein
MVLNGKYSFVIYLTNMWLPCNRHCSKSGLFNLPLEKNVPTEVRVLQAYGLYQKAFENKNTIYWMKTIHPVSQAGN